MDDEFDEDHNWDDDQAMEDEPEVDNNVIQQKCLEQFARMDFIMEPGIFSQLKAYFQAGGIPEKVIDLLSVNYSGVAQMSNLLAEWLILAGVKVDAVQNTVENHLKEMIIKCFDPKKSDDEFSRDEGSTSWWTEIIEFSTWRSLIYKLAEDFPDCVMLNFMIKLISDAGYQAEITSIATASQQIEVFSRILKTSISSFLSHPEDMEKNLQEFTKMVCHGEHTYLYSQAILQVLSQESKGGSNIRRLSQEINNCAWKNCSHNITPITMALSGAAAHPRASQALSSMLSRSALNPADITVLYKMYTQPDPPPIDLLRVPQFLDLLVDALFKPGSKLNPEHKPKYIYLLAYAASIYESYKKSVRKSLNKEELKGTMQAIEKVQSICTENKSWTELVAEVNTIYNCIRFPVVAIGVIRWVDCIVSDPSYFKLTTEHTPIHLAMLDEVVTCHNSLHQKVLDLLIRLFESKQEELDVLVQLERRKMLIDRMVHLFSRGCVVPVVNYIKTCWQQQDTDISLIRYFVTEVLDIIAPPYTAEFAQLFLPMVENEEITGSMRTEGDNDLISEFIVHCHGILK